MFYSFAANCWPYMMILTEGFVDTSECLKQDVKLQRGFLLRKSDVMSVEHCQLLSAHFIYISCIPKKMLHKTRVLLAIFSQANILIPGDYVYMQLKEL